MLGKIEIIYLEWNTAVWIVWKHLPSASDPGLGLGKGIEWVLNFIIVLYQQYFIFCKKALLLTQLLPKK